MYSIEMKTDTVFTVTSAMSFVTEAEGVSFQNALMVFLDKWVTKEPVQKYELVKPAVNETVKRYGLYRIRALKDVGIAVKKGDIGGWIANESNLSHEGLCWVYDDAEVDGDATISGNAKVSGNAWVYGNARAFGEAKVFGDARVFGYATVCGDARVFGNAEVHGNAKVFGDARVYGKAKAFGDAWVFGYATVCGDAKVYGNAQVSWVCVSQV